MEGRRHPGRARRARGLCRPARHRADHPQAPARRLPALGVPRGARLLRPHRGAQGHGRHHLRASRPCTRARSPAPSRPTGSPTRSPAAVAATRPKRVQEPAGRLRHRQLTRSADRATALELIERSLDGFVELHGDRLYADDPAIVAGHRLEGRPRAHGRGHRARQLHQGARAPQLWHGAPRGLPQGPAPHAAQAEKFGRPVLCLVDTSGAYCGIGAEERGQGEAIASSLVEMSGPCHPHRERHRGGGRLGAARSRSPWPTASSCSGSAAVLRGEPRGLRLDSLEGHQACGRGGEALHITASDLAELGLADAVVPDLGPHARRDRPRPHARGRARAPNELTGLTAEELVSRRYDKFRAMEEIAYARDNYRLHLWPHEDALSQSSALTSSP